MAKKPNLKPGEYGVQIVYESGAKKWKDVVLHSLEEAKAYILDLEMFEFSDKWSGIVLFDYEGNAVKYW